MFETNQQISQNQLFFNCMSYLYSVEIIEYL